MSSMSINGMSIQTKGKRLFVNGEEWGPLGSGQEAAPAVPFPRVKVEPGGTLQIGSIGGDLAVEGAGPCTIQISGTVMGSVHIENGNLEAETVSVEGSVTAGGDLEATTVGGSVEAGRDITCGDVDGYVAAGGNVTCGDVDGYVAAGGDVSRR